ncbi:MAG: hypothetical protein ACFFCW_27925 [Candidatus Hodarchaeota archaeon]
MRRYSLRHPTPHFQVDQERWSYTKKNLTEFGRAVDGKNGAMLTATVFIPKSQGPYKSELWNGKSYISYTTSGSRPGSGDFANDLNASSKRNLHRCILFGFWSSNFAERLDETLKKARVLSVRQNTEQVGRSECYVLDATVVTGQETVNYTVWLDPMHGYSPAKVEFKMQTLISRLDNIQFEKIDGIWIIKCADLRRRQVFNNGDFTNEVKHIRITEIKFNPDHDALGSFLPDDIRDGTRVGFINGNNTATSINTRGGQYKWKDCKVVDTSGRIVLDLNVE